MAQSLTPEQLEKQGNKHYQNEIYLEAAQVFLASASGYDAAGGTVKAAEMLNNASVAYLQAGDAEAALSAVGETPKLFSALNKPLNHAMALGNRAAALAALDHFDEAEALYWEAADLLKAEGETELRASLMQAISKLQMSRGRYLEAVASMQTGLEGVERPNFRQRMVKKLLKLPFNLLNRSDDQ